MSEQLTKSQIKKQIIEAAIKEYVGMSKSERSIAKTALKYGINKKTLTKYLKEKGIEIIANKGAYSIDESVFEIIDSEEKAY
jgi:DNA-binding phage protein